MCDQQRLRSACAYAQSDQSLCLSLEVKLPTKHHLEFLSLIGGCIGSSECTLVKMPHCWKSHFAAHLYNCNEVLRQDALLRHFQTPTPALSAAQELLLYPTDLGYVLHRWHHELHVVVRFRWTTATAPRSRPVLTTDRLVSGIAATPYNFVKRPRGNSKTGGLPTC